MFRSGFRTLMPVFLQFSRKPLQQGQSVNIKANPDFTGVLRTVTFFNKGNLASLLKSVTSVSPAGRRRGRGRGKQKQILNNPNKGQKIGVGEANILWPGLNSSLYYGNKYLNVKTATPDPEFYNKLAANRTTVLKKRMVSVHDLERGWSGRSMCGKRMEPPENIPPELAKDLEIVPLEVRNRNVMTSKKGKMKKVTVLLAVGNKKGALGFALADAGEFRLAMRRAFRRAILKLHYYKLEDPHTINHDFYYKFGLAKVFAYKRSEGHGLICHRALQECCKLIGIKNIYVKLEGSKNPRYFVKAFLLGLVDQKSFQQIADESGYHVVEFRKEHMSYPKLLASPIQGAQKERSNLLFQEYVMGKLPLAPKKHVQTAPDYEKNFKKTHYRRNFEDVRLRLRLKYGKLASYLTEIYPECEGMLFPPKK